MAKQLGPESLAILVLAQTYALIFNDLFNIQTWESMIKFGSAKVKSTGITNVIKANFFLDLVSAILAFVLALLLLKPAVVLLGWDTSYLNIFSLYSFSILFNITTFTIGIPRLFDKFLFVAKVYVVMAIIKLVAVLCAMFFANSLIVYVYIYLSINVLTSLSLITYSMTLLRSNYGRHWWKKGFKIDKDQIRFIWWTNLRTIIRIPVRHFDMIVISSVISIPMVGIYKVYKEIAGLMSRVGDPVNQSIFPEFTRLLGRNEIGKTIGVAKKTMSLLSGVGILLSISLILMSTFLVGAFFGKEYLPAINALYLMITLFGISFVTVPINSLFIAAGFAKYSFVVILFTNIIYLMTAFGLGRLIGIYGLVLAFAFQLILNKGLKILILKKHSSDWGMVIR